MPDMEGLETIVELRREYPGLKIIAISGGARDGKENYLKAAELCGASRILSKPFENQDLLQSVDELLNEDG
jgi:CheY-like chemotaxis protein